MQNEDHALREALEAVLPFLPIGFAATGAPNSADGKNLALHAAKQKAATALERYRAALSATPTRDVIPADILASVQAIGEVEWGATDAKSGEMHARDVENSVRLTAEHFEQTEPQPMHGLYLKGTGTVLCHTGTSPNSGQHARILAGAWNYLLGGTTPTPAPTYDDEISDEYLDTLQASINRGARRSSARFKLTPVAPAPIDMVLYCPACHVQHIDEASEGWSNPPHRSHLCHACGCIWRPADVATNGITSVKTCGKADTWGWDGKSLAAPIDNEALVEEVARAISGAPFPSKASFRKARAVLALPSIATRAQSAPVQAALVEEAIGALEEIVSKDQCREWTATSENPETHWEIHDGQFARIARATIAKLKEGRA